MVLNLGRAGPEARLSVVQRGQAMDGCRFLM
jgi:hypothetical protein